MVAKSFPRKQVPTKNFHQIYLVETFLQSQNHFLENRFLLKTFIKFFWSKFFMVAKSFPRKQVPTKNFHQIWSKIVYGRKIISSKTGSYQKFSENFLVEIFYGRKIHSSKTGSHQKSSSKIFWLKNCYGRKIISSKIGSYQ